MVDHWLRNEDHTHNGVEFSLKNCVLGYISFFVVAYIVFNCGLIIKVTVKKCCIPCYKKIRPC